MADAVALFAFFFIYGARAAGCHGAVQLYEKKSKKGDSMSHAALVSPFA
jgi:hypothetical protein